MVNYFIQEALSQFDQKQERREREIKRTEGVKERTERERSF